MKKDYDTWWGKIKLFVAAIASLPLPPCEVVTHKLSRALDGKLPLRDRVLVRLHLYTCLWCTRYDQHINLMSRAIRRAAAAAEEGLKLRNRLSPEARQRLKDSVRTDLE